MVVTVPHDNAVTAPLEVQCDDLYVAGFPLHVAVTVRPARPTVTLPQLPLMDVFSSRGAIGFSLACPDGTVVYEVEPARPGVHADGPSFALHGDDCRRMLVDLSEAFGQHWPAGIPEGHLLLTVRYEAAGERPRGGPVPITVRRPTPEEQQVLDALAPELTRARSFGRWMFLPPEAPAGPPDAQSLAGDPLRFGRVLRYLLFEAGTTSPQPVELLSALDGLYAPEAAVLLAAWWQLTGDRAAYAVQHTRVHTAYPELSAAMAALERGENLLGPTQRRILPLDGTEVQS